MNESLKIVLTQIKKENITEEETIRLILDITNNSYRCYYPYYINDEKTNPNEFIVTCNNENNSVSKVQE